MILRESRQVIMPPADDPDEGDLPGVKRLQLFTLADGYEPVFSTMQDIGMTVHFGYPLIAAKVVPQNIFNRENGKESFYRFPETEIRRIQYQVAGFVIGRQLGCKPTAQAAAVNDQVVFRISGFQAVVHKLHIIQHIFFRTLTGTLAKTAVVHQHHVIIIAVKIPGILGPSFNAAGVAMKIKDQPQRFVHEKMKPVDPYAGLYIKEQFPERRIILVLEILL